MIRRAAVSRRVWYWNGGSVTFFPWGVHVHRRRVGYWRQYRLAFFSRHPKKPGTYVVDYSVRDTVRANTKPIAPCWRFWIGVKAGRTWSDKHYGKQDA